ncbi:MAG: SRPBCC family protein [Nocardioidaceae bacterium]
MTRTVMREGSVEVTVDASPDQVWAVLTDVTRIGEWSHECKAARWLEGSPAAPVVGARFRGRNKAGLVRWSRPCTVTEADVARRFAYRTKGSLADDSTEWVFTLEPSGSGTRLAQSFRVLSLARWAEILIARLVPQHQDRRADLTADLERLGELAGASQGQP